MSKLILNYWRDKLRNLYVDPFIVGQKIVAFGFPPNEDGSQYTGEDVIIGTDRYQLDYTLAQGESQYG